MERQSGAKLDLIAIALAPERASGVRAYGDVVAKALNKLCHLILELGALTVVSTAATVARDEWVEAMDHGFHKVSHGRRWVVLCLHLVKNLLKVTPNLTLGPRLEVQVDSLLGKAREVKTLILASQLYS